MDVFAAPRTDEPSETTSPSPRRPRDRGCPFPPKPAKPTV